jgi:O-antigen ligase
MGLLVCSAGLVGTAIADLILNKGVAYGTNLPKVPHTRAADLGANPVGVNTFFIYEQDRNNIIRTLDMLKEARVGFIRQLFAWEDIEYQGRGDFRDKNGKTGWDLYDFIVQEANTRGIQVIARLDRPPIWARLKVLDTLPTEELKRTVTGPPDDYAEFGRFVETTVNRYKGKVKYFQLWNEPNLEAEWNAKKVDPAAYTQLLKIGYQAAKRVNPDSVIIAAALAPTDQNSPEFNNLNELVYLDRMYQAGAQAYFDVMAAQIYGLGYSPEFRYTEPDFKYKDLKRVNFSRVVDLRAVMEKWGDFAKPVWATEYGWLSLPPNLPQNTNWGESVSEQVQGEYIVGGIERAREEWYWMGVMNLWFFRSDDLLEAEKDGTDKGNQKGFALVRRDFTPRPAFNRLRDYLGNFEQVAGVGYTPVKVQPDFGRPFRFYFQGQRLDIELRAESDTRISLRIDGKDPVTVSGFSNSNSIKTLADNLPYDVHLAEITISGGTATVQGFYASRFNGWSWLLTTGYVAFSAGIVATVAGLAVRFLTLLELFWAWLGALLWRLLGWAWRNRAELAPYGMIFVLLVYYFAPPFALAVLGASLFLPLVLIRPDWAIFLAIFTAPMYLEPRNLRASLDPLTILRGFLERPDPNAARGAVLEFSLAEVIIVMSLGAWILREVWDWFGRWRRAKNRDGLGIPPQPSPPRVFPQGAREQNPIPSDSAIANRHSLITWVSSLVTRHAPLVLFLPLVAFFSLCIVSLLAPSSSYLREALREFRVVVVEPLILYLLIVRFLKTTNQVQRVFNVLIISGVLIAGVGIYQFLFTKENTVTAEGVSRVISIYNHPDNLGLYLGRVIPLAAAIAFFSLEWTIKRWLYLASLGIMGIGLGLCFSRGAWIATAAALLVMVVVVGSRKGLIVAGLAFLGGLALLPFIRLERITSLFNFGAGSSGTRINLWSSSIEMIKDNPITGIGLDQFLYKYQVEYVLPQAWLERFTSHPHNIVLDFWLRLGVLGPVVLAWLLFIFFKWSFRLTRLPKDGEFGQIKLLALGLLGSMTAFLVHGLVDNSYFVIDLAVVFCASCAMLEILRRNALALQKQPGGTIIAKPQTDEISNLVQKTP